MIGNKVGQGRTEGGQGSDGASHGSLEFAPKTTTHRAGTGRNCIGMSHFITFSRRVKSDTMPRIVGIPQAVERGINMSGPSFFANTCGACGVCQ